MFVRVIVWVCAVLRGWKEGASFADPRVAWMRSQAVACVAEGMTPWEAVALAGDLAFRCYGRERSSTK